MKRREYNKLENKFQRLITNFWFDHEDVTPDWIIRILIETANGFVPRVDEYYEERTDYDHAEKYARMRDVWNDENISKEEAAWIVKGLLEEKE